MVVILLDKQNHKVFLETQVNYELFVPIQKYQFLLLGDVTQLPGRAHEGVRPGGLRDMQCGEL